MFEGVVATILNRFLGNYVTNLETTQLKLGIWQGDVKLEKLRLKADALDKLRLPVDIKEGWLGTLTISIPWSNLKGEPVRIHIDNVYVLATPRFQENFDPEREDEREFKRKMQRLENDDLMRQQQLLKNRSPTSADEEKKQASFTEQLVTKIVDNLQIVIKNIHVRYEDNISNPEHMFAVGASLGELSAVSTDEEWRETFLHDSGSVIHKLLKLAQFSVYWDTDCQTMQGLNHDELIARFSQAANPDSSSNSHQSILLPVVGLGRLAMNKRPSPEDVRTMLKFEFDQLAFELDDEQYTDALLLTTAFDYAMRQRRYRKHRPPPGVRPKDDPRAWLLFAIRSVYDEVHEHNYRKTWQYKKQRREERQLYIRLYTATKTNNDMLPEVDRIALDNLHHSLAYEDIRHYRVQAESTIRKQQYFIRKREEEVAKANAGSGGSAATDAKGGAAASAAGVTGWVGGWIGSWITGAPNQGQGAANSDGSAGDTGADADAATDDADSAQLSEKQVQELYDTIEFNEEEADLAADEDLPRETIKLAATAILRSASLKLKVDRKGRDHTLMGFMFNILKIDLLQRPQNLVADVSMHRFEVVDGTLPNTQYPRMIYLQGDDSSSGVAKDSHGQPDIGSEEDAFAAIEDAPGGLASHLEKDGPAGTSPMLDARRKLKDPFLEVHFEQHPLDGHADSVFNVKVKSLNVIYHPTAVEAIMDYFEPPSSASAESIHALIAAASKSMAGFRDQTRVGLEYALAQHKTVDVKVDFDAPVFVIPQDMLDPNSEVVVLDTGYLTIESQLVDSATTERIRQKHNQALSDEEMKDLESLMYDHFDMQLHRAQLLVGNGLDSCMRALREGKTNKKLHVVDRIELNLDLGLCILSEPPLHMPKVTVDGSLPSLQVYFSDRKYKAIMGSIDLILEAIKDEDVDLTQQYEVAQVSTAFGAGGLFQSSSSSGSDAEQEEDPHSLSMQDESSGDDHDDVGNDDDDRHAGSRDGRGADSTDERDAESGDEFFESTDQIGEEQAGVAPTGRLLRKAAKETRVDVGKEPDRVTVRVNFAVDNLVGFVWRTHTDGREDLHIGDIAVTGLAVECINRPFDLFADVTIHQVTVEDHLMGNSSSVGGSNDVSPSSSPHSNGGALLESTNRPATQRVYALTSDIAQADANGETGKNLVAVKYHRCQADHPEFTTTYESIGQTVDVDISYIDLMVVRKTILTTYDYILKTFTDEGDAKAAEVPKNAAKDNTSTRGASEAKDSRASREKKSGDGEATDNVSSLIREALDTIRVDVRFKGTDFSLCHDDGSPIALVSVTAATMRVLLTQQMLVEAKIGNITLADQLDLVPAEDSNVTQSSKYSQQQQDHRRLLLYIKSDELADFRYETFDEQSPSYPGHNAAIKLRLGAAHMTFMERPICELMRFGSRFSAMYGVFEAARQAAAHGTTQLTEEMMGSGNKYHFDVVMSAPVITFPRDGIVPYGALQRNTGGKLGVDVLVAQPGELTISNEFTTVREMGKDWDVNHISLALRRIGIKSEFVIEDDRSDHGTFGQAGEQELQILEDVDYKMDMHVLTQGHIDGCPRPVTELVGVLSPIKMKLTEYQYKMAYDLLLVIGRVFGGDPNQDSSPDPLMDDRTLDLAVLRENPATQGAKDTRQALTNLRQLDSEGGSSSGKMSDERRGGQYATADLFVTLNTIQVELFQGSGFDLESMRKASFTRMDINELSVKYRMKANGDSKAEMAIMAVRAYDTRPGTANQFTQIISPTVGSGGGGGSARKDGDAGSNAGDAHSHGSMHALAQDSPVEEAGGSPQLICHVDMRPNQDMVVLLTLDSPRIILVLDHVFLLIGFATSAFPQQQQQQQQPVQQTQTSPARGSATTPGSDDGSQGQSDNAGGLIYKVDILHPEIIVLADAKSRASEALILTVNQIILAQEGMFCATMDEIGVALCSIDRRQDTARNVMDPFTVIATMDSRAAAGDGQPSFVTDVSVDVGNLLLRLGINDVLLMLDIFNAVTELMYATGEETGAQQTEEAKLSSRQGSTAVSSASPPGLAAADSLADSASVASAPPALRQGGDRTESVAGSTAGGGRLVKETLRATVASLRIVIIRDMSGLPAYACTAQTFHVDAADWTTGLRVRSDVQLQASYFNRRNSHWEPLVEPWRVAVRVAAAADAQRHVDVTATDRLLINASHALMEETLGLAAQWDDEVARRRQQRDTATGERMPYELVNRTGIDCHVWVDATSGSAGRMDTSPVLLRDGARLPWRFEDWRRRREQLEAAAHHLGVQFANGQWEWLRRVQVDREGVRHYALQPAIDGMTHRLAVDVRLDAVRRVKRVVLRSPLVVENRTRVPMQVAMCDYRGELRTDAALLQPGDDLPLPILFCHQYAVRVRPDPAFGYAWSSQYIYWRDFLAPDARTELRCDAEEETADGVPAEARTHSGDAAYAGGRNSNTYARGSNAAASSISRSSNASAKPNPVQPFYVHFNAMCDPRNPALYKYPFMRLAMTAPLELENLLPYAMDVCVIDKTADRKWVGSLPRGGVAPVHVVQPGHLVLLTIRIAAAGFEQCDGTIIETDDPDEYPVDDSIVVADRQGIRLGLKLHRMDIPASGGRCRRISVYAPYVMVNRSGLKLFYSSKGFFKGVSAVAGQHVDANSPQQPSQQLASDSAPVPSGASTASDTDSARPLMFSFGSYDLKNRALVRVADSQWSRPLSFDALGSAAEVVIPAADRGSDTHLGIAIEPGRGRYSHTRVVTFTSRYVVKNMAGVPLLYRSVHGAAAPARLNDGERQPLHTLPRSRRRLLAISCAADKQWSAPFSIDDVGRVHVRVPVSHGGEPGSAGNELLLKVDVLLEGACLFVVIQREDRCWPYLIENLTPTDVVVWQQREKPGEQSTSAMPTERRYMVRAGASLDYAWDEPTTEPKLLVISAQGNSRRVSLQEIGEQRPFVYGRTASATMNVEVAASGPRQVLRLSAYAPEHSLYAPRVTRSATMHSQRSSMSQRTADERFEVVEPDDRTSLAVRFALEGGIGVSLINRYSSEILFATLADVEAKYSASTSNQTFRLSVKWLQVDNQIYGALFPIVLYPTTLGATAAGVSAPPALQLVIVRAKDRSYGVEYFKYASVLAQEISVELDEDFLYALLDFVRFDVPGSGGSSDGGSDGDSDAPDAMLASAIPEASALDAGLQLYFEFLHIQPFKINISFMRTQRLDAGGDPTAARYPAGAEAGGTTGLVSYSPAHGLAGAPADEHGGEGVASSSGVVAYAMNVLTMAIGNVNEAPVSLNALVMQNVRVSLPVLADRMHKHYSQELFNQLYKVVGSANLLGNPVGLFTSISSGVSDFFYEPYQGFVMSDRPQDFGFGLARGTASLFKKTVFGMTDSFSKFTDSMSKGLSAATLDPRFQTERSMSRVRNKPKHAIYGVARGAESFARSVSSGLAGVVMRPLEGAEQDGFGGFFRGVGKGLVGAVTKPVVGMFDLASNVTEGIRNTTTVFERDLDRQRLPRHIGRDGIICVYDARAALGQAWMRELSKGAFAADDYLAHLELPGSDMVVLLTYQRLAMFRRAKPDDAAMTVGAAGSSAETGSATGAVGISAANASKAHVEWVQEIRSLHSIQLEATGISLKLPATQEGYVPPGPFIPVSDPTSRRWFYAKIRDAVKALIDHRKELG
ncbi:Vacuolar protein sorting-associated protein 13 [Coemansia guatemalensis]|uniref:Vacuolar protein sorting-associated protein 13 n=1 Tax=Coemansia guatemalensis TaxID=2761395 RepID=A0A9W8HZ40_9FUNG|nr:Vacuolar protein sorting-associated protein 13 [Coemansia guatemalensis]